MENAHPLTLDRLIVVESKKFYKVPVKMIIREFKNVEDSPFCGKLFGREWIGSTSDPENYPGGDEPDE